MQYPVNKLTIFNVELKMEWGVCGCQSAEQIYTTQVYDTYQTLHVCMDAYKSRVRASLDQ